MIKYKIAGDIYVPLVKEFTKSHDKMPLAGTD